MKFTKTLLASSVAAALAVSAVAPVANAAEVGASVGVASSYLWRGIDLGSGTPAVSGDLNVSTDGFYGGLWTSSGDTGSGSEWDIYAGWGAESGDFSYGLGVATYIYPSATGIVAECDAFDEEGEEACTGVEDYALGYVSSGDDNIGDLTEVILSLGYGAVSANYYHNVVGADYGYLNVAASMGKYTAAIGADMGDDSNESVHIDLSYAYNDNLSFTFSQFIEDNDNTVDDDLKFVVSYSLPIE